MVRGGSRFRARHGARHRYKRGYKYEGTPKIEKPEIDIPIEDVRGLFINSTTFEKHFESQKLDSDLYLAHLLCLIKYKVEISPGSKSKALAAAIARADHKLMTTLLSKKDVFGTVEVVKALSMLDSKRQIRVAEKRMNKLKALHGVKKSKISKMKYTIDNLKKNSSSVGSVSGAVSRHIRRWVRSIPAAELEFYALHYPKDPWCKIADLVHLNPKKDFQLDWFLSYCFGSCEAPSDSMVGRSKNLTKENVNSIIGEIDIPYAHVKDFVSSLTPQSKQRIAEYESLTTIVWWYEDLVCNEVNEILDRRLKAFIENEDCGKDAKDELKLTYGKIMERLFVLRKKTSSSKVLIDYLFHVAEKELKNISLPFESPVAVLGDRSSSMQVCVKVSNIIASLLTTICDAKINFFNSGVIDPPFVPTNVQGVLELGESIKASGSTAPAASLYPFFENKEKINTFIVVTDEEENTDYKEYNFARLYKEYSEVVAKAKLVFVSFLSAQHTTGEMVESLQKHDIFDVKQFIFNQRRPDLTKLDSMFAELSSECNWFRAEVENVKTTIQEEGVISALEKWSL